MDRRQYKSLIRQIGNDCISKTLEEFRAQKKIKSIELLNIETFEPFIDAVLEKKVSKLVTKRDWAKVLAFTSHRLNTPDFNEMQLKQIVWSAMLQDITRYIEYKLDFLKGDLIWS